MNAHEGNPCSVLEGSTHPSLLLSIFMVFLLSVIMVFTSLSIVLHCCGCPSSPPHALLLSVSIVIALLCSNCCVLSSSLCCIIIAKCGRGEAMMWQWLAGVIMATGGVVAIRKKKEGDWRAYNVICSPALLWTAMMKCIVAVWMSLHIWRGPLACQIVFSMCC